MKNDFFTTETRLATVWCSSITVKDQGLHFEFTDVITGEVYEHFQPTPADSGRGESKARKFLRQMARSADIHDPDYLVLDFTQENPLRDTKPIIGRVFQIFVKVKKAVADGQGRKAGYIIKSGESIWHFEGDSEFSIQTVLYIMARSTDPLKQENLLKRLVDARKAYSYRTFNEYWEYMELKMKH